MGLLMNNKELLKRKGGVFPKGQLSINDVISDVKQNPNVGDAGAIACFIGQTRRTSQDGRSTVKLEIEAYDEQADTILDRIACEIIQMEGIIDARIYHATGTFEIGEDLVFVIIAGAHRTELFSALHIAVERYKTEAPVWKKEYLTTGEAYWTTH